MLDIVLQHAFLIQGYNFGVYKFEVNVFAH